MEGFLVKDGENMYSAPPPCFWLGLFVHFRHLPPCCVLSTRGGAAFEYRISVHSSRWMDFLGGATSSAAVCVYLNVGGGNIYYSYDVFYMIILVRILLYDVTSIFLRTRVLCHEGHHRDHEVTPRAANTE